MSCSNGEEGCWSTKEALRNSLILQRIFSFFPTKFLFASCSLVNKTWNMEARTFIRDHRNFRAVRGGQTTECEFIQQLDDLCVQITKAGRVIPWSGLSMLSGLCGSRVFKFSKHSKPDGKMEFKSQLELKCLAISWMYRQIEADCHNHKSLTALLRQTCPHLRRLELFTLSLTFPNHFRNPFPAFPTLEELAFQNSPVNRNKKDQAAQKVILRRILEGSPNLKKIEANGLWALEVVPPEMYGLLTTMEFNFSMDLSPEMFAQLLAMKPDLKKLLIYQPFPIDCVQRLPFRNLLQQTLQTCCQGLGTISMLGLCPLGEFSFPALENLTKLTLDNWSASRDGYWTVLSSIDYERQMPRLKQIEIKLNTVLASGCGVLGGNVIPLWPDPSENWNRNGAAVPRCKSLKRLKLEVEARELNLELLKTVFPNVSKMELIMSHNRVLRRTRLIPVAQVSEFWPDLEELEITGEHNVFERCYDAEFCGIHEEEVDLLRQMDQNSLRRMQVVPIKPCLMTLPKLWNLRVDLKFDVKVAEKRNTSGTGPEELFTSKVTELLVLKRIWQAAISAPFIPVNAYYFRGETDSDSNE